MSNGSRKWFKYTTTLGDNEVFAVNRDESNTEAVNGSSYDFATGDNGVVIYALPRNLTPRRARYRTADGTRNILVTVLNEDVEPPATIDYGGTTLSFAGTIPERIVQPVAFDSGLNDGDDT
jgi:hypothetical protein